LPDPVFTEQAADPVFTDPDGQRYEAYLRDAETVRRFNAVVFVDRGQDAKANGRIVVREPTKAELAGDWRTWDPAEKEPAKFETLIEPPDTRLAGRAYEKELYARVIAALEKRAQEKRRG
jgi:hypothetical protein